MFTKFWAISAVRMLPWVDMIYFISLGFVAFFTVISFGAGIAQYILNNGISGERDKTIASLNSDAASLNAKSAELTHQNILLQADLEDEKRKRHRRKLTGEQIALFISVLKENHSKPIKLIYRTGEEARLYTQQFTDALRDANLLDGDGASFQSDPSFTWQGIWIYCADAPDVKLKDDGTFFQPDWDYKTFALYKALRAAEIPIFSYTAGANSVAGVPIPKSWYEGRNTMFIGEKPILD